MWYFVYCYPEIIVVLIECERDRTILKNKNMSMTQAAFLKRLDMPSKFKIEESINKLGYEFKILDEFVDLYNQEGLSCEINGYKTYFEIYFDEPSEIINDFEWIEKDLTNEDIVISFVWGADFAAGACIGLVSVALIDNCNALIYYLDDEMKYSRQMLLDDMPQFLNELEKENNRSRQNSLSSSSEFKQTKKSFLDKVKGFFK